MISRNGDNKRKADSDDIGSFLTLLDDHKVTSPKFVAHYLKRISPIEPGTADLCFLLESIEDFRKKVDSLINIRKDVADLQTAVKSLLQSQPPSYSFVLMASQQKSPVFHQHNSSNLLQLSNSQPLHANFPPLLNSINSVSYVSPAVPSNANTFRRKPAVIGTKSTADGSLKLKVSLMPRIFHLYVGNLDVSIKSEDLSNYLKEF